MVPDGSLVRILRVIEHEDAPAGIQVAACSPLFAEDEKHSVIAFQEDLLTGRTALYIKRMMLADNAPAHLATVGFGLMAVSAYRLGFSSIYLFAAGHGPIARHERDLFIGYEVWPKLGFDAPVDPAELNRDERPGLQACRTVQQVRAFDADWWSRYGSGRTMQFDLSPGSRSWMVLLDYLYTTLREDV